MSALATNYQVVFAADLAKFEAILHGRLDELAQHVGLAIAESVTVGNDMSPGTPVKTGFARNSWAVGIGGEPAFPQPPSRPKEAKDQAVSVTSLADASTALLEAHAGDIVYIVSNCVYMEALEFGHSGQAPNGMVRLTALALPGKVQQIVAGMTA
jgi:hypothetical protein